MAQEQSNWQRIQPDTPLSELTAGDLMEAIGWALASDRGGGKPKMKMKDDESRVGAMVPGWKEVGVWGSWRSNWWGLPANEE
jgi:hypothetical protein